MTEFESLCLYLTIYAVSAFLIGCWTKQKYVLIGCIGMMIPIVFAALRYGVGTDFFNYMQIWQGESYKTYKEIFARIYSEPGYHLIAKYTADNWDESVYLGFCAALTLIPVIISYKKQFKNQYLGFFAFLYLLTIFTNSFNITRQGIAIAFTFVASGYIFERKFKLFLLWIFVAAMFHFTAIIFIPTYFLYSKGSSLLNLKRIGIITIVILVVVFLTSVLDALNDYEAFEKFAVYSGERENANNRSILFTVLFLALYIGKRKKMKLINSRSDTYIIFLIIGFIIEFTGFFNPFIKRVSTYFYLYTSILAWFWIKSFEYKKKFATFFILLIFISRFIISTYILKQANILPYHTKQDYYETNYDD